MLVAAAAAAGSAKAEELDIWCDLDSRSAAAVEIDGKFAVIVDRLHELRGEISDLAAVTPEGLAAKAAVVLVDLSEDGAGTRTVKPHDDQQWIAWSLARDIAGRAVG